MLDPVGFLEKLKCVALSTYMLNIPQNKNAVHPDCTLSEPKLNVKK
jgi:hypothetical protein